MRAAIIFASALALSGCMSSEPSSVERFNAQSDEDRRAAINSCLAELNRPPAPAGPLRIEPPLTPQEGSVFANCISRSA